jgi:hypothetical protein
MQGIIALRYSYSRKELCFFRYSYSSIEWFPGEISLEYNSLSVKCLDDDFERQVLACVGGVDVFDGLGSR